MGATFVFLFFFARDMTQNIELARVKQQVTVLTKKKLSPAGLEPATFRV